MRGLKGLTAAVVACSFGMWMTSVAALAGKPDKQPVPPPPDFVVDCGPGIGLVNSHFVESEYSKTFTAPDGSQRILINGPAHTTFTRLSDGKSITVNSSGPVSISVDASGTTTSIIGRGQSTVVTPTSARQYTGRIVVVVEPTTVDVISHTGRVTDICQLLA